MCDDGRVFSLGVGGGKGARLKEGNSKKTKSAMLNKNKVKE